MTTVTTRRTLHETRTELSPDVRFVRRMNDAYVWDTSTEAVQRIYEHLKADRTGFVDG